MPVQSNDSNPKFDSEKSCELLALIRLHTQRITKIEQMTGHVLNFTTTTTFQLASLGPVVEHIITGDGVPPLTISWTPNLGSREIEWYPYTSTSTSSRFVPLRPLLADVTSKIDLPITIDGEESSRFVLMSDCQLHIVHGDRLSVFNLDGSIITETPLPRPGKLVTDVCVTPIGITFILYNDAKEGPAVFKLDRDGNVIPFSNLHDSSTCTFFVPLHTGTGPALTNVNNIVVTPEGDPVISCSDDRRLHRFDSMGRSLGHYEMESSRPVDWLNRRGFCGCAMRFE